jgi:thioesterase domain-containing protein
MNASELQAYIFSHIPLSAAMQVNVIQATPEFIELRAPLAPNINHRGTAFGGSIVTLATLACWSLLRIRTDDLQPAPRLVVHRSNIEYTKPIPGEFTAVASFPPSVDWQAFLTRYKTWGRARLTLESQILSDEIVAAQFSGEFVALA